MSLYLQWLFLFSCYFGYCLCCRGICNRCFCCLVVFSIAWVVVAQLGVELVQWRTADSEVSGSNPRLDSYFKDINQVTYHEWSGMVETHALYREVGEKKYPRVESSTWRLNSHNCSENYTKSQSQSQLLFLLSCCFFYCLGFRCICNYCFCCPVVFSIAWVVVAAAESVCLDARSPLQSLDECWDRQSASARRSTAVSNCQ